MTIETELNVNAPVFVPKSIKDEAILYDELELQFMNANRWLFDYVEGNIPVIDFERWSCAGMEDHEWLIGGDESEVANMDDCPPNSEVDPCDDVFFECEEEFSEVVQGERTCADVVKGQ